MTELQTSIQNLKKKNRFGWEYYESLPQDYRLAKMDDFHFNGRKRIGLEFLIQWQDNKNFFQVCIVSENLTAAFIKPFIEAGRVFIKK